MEELLKLQQEALNKLASVMYRYALTHGIEPAKAEEGCETDLTLLTAAQDYVDVAKLYNEMAVQDHDIVLVDTLSDIVDSTKDWQNNLDDQLAEMAVHYACERLCPPVVETFTNLTDAAAEWTDTMRLHLTAERLLKK